MPRFTLSLSLALRALSSFVSPLPCFMYHPSFIVHLFSLSQMVLSNSFSLSLFLSFLVLAINSLSHSLYLSLTLPLSHTSYLSLSNPFLSTRQHNASWNSMTWELEQYDTRHGSALRVEIRASLTQGGYQPHSISVAPVGCLNVGKGAQRFGTVFEILTLLPGSIAQVPKDSWKARGFKEC